MKNGVNKAFLIGHIGKKPEKLEFENSTLLKFTLATSESYKDKNNNEWKQSTEWHNIAVWGPRAQGLSKFLRKGDPVYVEGKITQRSWEDKEGNKRYMTEIVARDVKPLGGGSSSDQGQEEPPKHTDDDIPF
jgi:single-strand DNA-binding protein